MKEGKWTTSTHKGEVVHVVFFKVWLNLQDQRGDDIQTQGERQGLVFIWEDVCLKIFLTFL